MGGPRVSQRDLRRLNILSGHDTGLARDRETIGHIEDAGHLTSQGDGLRSK